MQKQQDQSTDNRLEEPTQEQIDLALLFQTDLYVGQTAFTATKGRRTSLNLRYTIDGVTYQRRYLSPLSWRAVVMFALLERRTITVHDLDQPGRLRSLFPNTLLRRLGWHARPNANFPPVARLYDPSGNTVMLLTRSRLGGHAVDALHNLSKGGPVFQPLWISDIMALRPRHGIDIVLDETFTAASPISLYINAAAKTGLIVDPRELPELDLSDTAKPLALPRPAPTVSRIFEQQSCQYLQLKQLRGRTIYDDYSL